MSPPISHSAMISLLISFVLGIASTAFLTENDSPSKPAKRDLAQATALKVYPEAVNITHARDQQSLVVQALMPNGTTVDVTEQVSWKIGNEKAARLENQRLLPVADGVTELTVSLGDLKAQVPVSVTNSATRHPISFELDVMPVFMKAGCNSGGCHGAARGKDGFRLSLYGFDPKGDYHRLTREMAGRRIDLSLPENCLLIEKAAGEVSHTGGQLIKKDDVYYRTLVEWLNDGAPTDAAAVPKVEKIEVYPPSAI
ncbi:MAG: cell surface protein, partial [Planctomycetaceae bacterium]|nr:cell surface protein [Planctomycetaceae bacterium]